MGKRRKKKIFSLRFKLVAAALLAALIVIALVASPKRPASPHAATQSATETHMNSPVDQIDRMNQLNAELKQYLQERRLVRDEVVLPARDPFLSFELRARSASLEDEANPSEQGRVDELKAATAEPVDPKDLNLSATLVSGDGKLALVNGETLAEGDTIRGFQVVQIAPGAMVLEGRFGTFALEIGKEGK